MKTAIETIKDKIKILYSEIENSGKDEFATESKLRVSKILELECAIITLQEVK